MPLEFLKTFFIQCADLAHPGGRAALQFRVVFGFPRSSRSAESVSLLMQLDLALGQIHKKSCAPAGSRDLIDCGDYIRRILD